MDIAVALQNVLKNARVNDALARGLREVTKALESKRAEFVIIAESCNDKAYIDLVKALASDCKIPVIVVQNGQDLGQWCGLVRYDRTQADKQVIKKTVKCSSCAVLKGGLSPDARETKVVLEHIEQKK